MCEESRRDRQLIAAKRARDPPPDETVGAVGADHASRAQRPLARLDANPVAFHAQVGDPRAPEFYAGGDGRRHERAVKCRTARDEESSLRSGRGVFERNGRASASSGLDKPRRTHPACGDARVTDSRCNQFERAPGDAAAARLLTRMRRIDQRDARAAPRERIRRPRACGAGADDSDVLRDGPRHGFTVRGEYSSPPRRHSASSVSATAERLSGASTSSSHHRATLHGHGRG